MIAAAVQQDERRRARIAPVDVMQAQALREVHPRGRAGGFVVEHGGKSGSGMRGWTRSPPARSAYPRHLPRCAGARSEEHTSELQSLTNLVCRLLLEKKNIYIKPKVIERHSRARVCVELLARRGPVA